MCARGRVPCSPHPSPGQIHSSDVRIKVQRSRVAQVEQMALGNLWETGLCLHIQHVCPKQVQGSRPGGEKVPPEVGHRSGKVQTCGQLPAMTLVVSSRRKEPSCSEHILGMWRPPRSHYNGQVPLHGIELCAWAPRQLYFLGLCCARCHVPGRDRGGGLSTFNRPGRSISELWFQGNVIPRVYWGSSF